MLSYLFAVSEKIYNLFLLDNFFNIKMLLYKKQA